MEIGSRRVIEKFKALEILWFYVGKIYEVIF